MSRYEHNIELHAPVLALPRRVAGTGAQLLGGARLLAAAGRGLGPRLLLLLLLLAVLLVLDAGLENLERDRGAVQARLGRLLLLRGASALQARGGQPNTGFSVL